MTPGQNLSSKSEVGLCWDTCSAPSRLLVDIRKACRSFLPCTEVAASVKTDPRELSLKPPKVSVGVLGIYLSEDCSQTSLQLGLGGNLGSSGTCFRTVRPNFDV